MISVSSAGQADAAILPSDSVAVTEHDCNKVKSSTIKRKIATTARAADLCRTAKFLTAEPVRFTTDSPVLAADSTAVVPFFAACTV